MGRGWVIQDECGASSPLTQIKICQHLGIWKATYIDYYKCVCVCLCVCARENVTLSTAPLASSSKQLKWLLMGKRAMVRGRALKRVNIIISCVWGGRDYEGATGGEAYIYMLGCENRQRHTVFKIWHCSRCTIYRSHTVPNCFYSHKCLLHE